MLKVIGHIEIKETSLEMDGYVPLSFRCWEVRSELTVPTYWQLGNLKTSLIEIGIGQDNGGIFDVTVVAIEEIKHLPQSSEVGKPAETEIVKGLPLCDVDNTVELSYFHEKMEVFAGYTDESVVIWFGEKCVEQKIYQAERLMFGVNQNDEICSLRVNDLSSEELINFLSTISSK